MQDIALGVLAILAGASFCFRGQLVLRFLGTVLGWAVGLAFAVVAIVTDVPMLLLILFSSFAGASVAVTGIMLTFGVVDSADFDEAALRSSVRENWS